MSDKSVTLYRYMSKSQPFTKDNGPGKQGKNKQENQYGYRRRSHFLHETHKCCAACCFSFGNLQENKIQNYGFGPSLGLITLTLKETNITGYGRSQTNLVDIGCHRLTMLN